MRDLRLIATRRGLMLLLVRRTNRLLVTRFAPTIFLTAPGRGPSMAGDGPCGQKRSSFPCPTAAVTRRPLALAAHLVGARADRIPRRGTRRGGRAEFAGAVVHPAEDLIPDGGSVGRRSAGVGDQH